MADQKVLARKANPSRLDIHGAPKARLNDVDESSPGDERAEPWTAGFVTSEGTHIPLFVPRVPQEFASG